MTEPATPLETNLAPEANPKDKAQAQDTVQDQTALEHVHLPRIAIKFCTQCRWMLRAAYVRPIHVPSLPYPDPFKNGLLCLDTFFWRSPLHIIRTWHLPRYQL